jgi:transcription elongation factor GreA
MKKEFHLTDEGIAELKRELDQLNAEKPVIADKIRLAREQGDLAENAEYQIAKEELSRVETRTAEIKRILQNVELIDGSSRQADKVRIGTTVTLKSGSEKVSYTIVGSVEADPLEKKISDVSPIGKALMGNKVGDSAEITTPAGTVSYKIVSIT